MRLGAGGLAGGAWLPSLPWEFLSGRENKLRIAKFNFTPGFGFALFEIFCSKIGLFRSWHQRRRQFSEHASYIVERFSVIPTWQLSTFTFDTTICCAAAGAVETGCNGGGPATGALDVSTVDVSTVNAGGSVVEALRQKYTCTHGSNATCSSGNPLERHGHCCYDLDGRTSDVGARGIRSLLRFYPTRLAARSRWAR